MPKTPPTDLPPGKDQRFEPMPDKGRKFEPFYIPAIGSDRRSMARARQLDQKR